MEKDKSEAEKLATEVVWQKELTAWMDLLGSVVEMKNSGQKEEYEEALRLLRVETFRLENPHQIDDEERIIERLNKND